MVHKRKVEKIVYTFCNRIDRERLPLSTENQSANKQQIKEEIAAKATKPLPPFSYVFFSFLFSFIVEENLNFLEFFTYNVYVWYIFIRGGSVFLSIGLHDATVTTVVLTLRSASPVRALLLFFSLSQAFDNFCKIVFFVSFVFFSSALLSFVLLTSLFIRVVEKFTPHIICDNCRLRSYRLFSLYQICSVAPTVFPFECM